MQKTKYVPEVHQEWPAEGLEHVSNCPVCGSSHRVLLHGTLTDKIFFCAPGEWLMYRCDSCSSAYLDPRPTIETIGLAYQQYFTHDEGPDFSSLSFLDRIRRRLANGYRNYRYGTQVYPSSFLGILAVSLMPKGRSIIDASMRHLPKALAGKRLLDLGCGNGDFLLRARSTGLDVVGVDFDLNAVMAAHSQGLDVRLGGVESLDPSVEQFDIITLSHVIEHVHHPVVVLQACFELLTPGGFLWIETPNIEAEGHQLFGASWRGLEPPRHLVLFSLDSMCNTLSKIGFSEVKTQAYRPLCAAMFSASQAIKEGIDPYSDFTRNVPPELIKKSERIAVHESARREFITIKAWKT